MAFGRVNPPGLVYKIDLSKIADRENPRTVEAPIFSVSNFTDSYVVDWGDGTTQNYSASDGAFPVHEYAQGAGDVFTVVIRSANGNLPRIGFNRNQNQSDTTNATYAVTSLDHFGGATGGLTRLQYNYVFMYAANMTYCDPRFVGQPNLADLYKMFQSSGLAQAIESFCLDFGLFDNSYTFDSAFQNTKVYGVISDNMFRYCAYATRAGSAFQNCKNLTGVETHAFDNCVSLTTFGSTFRGCTGLPNPYIFWKADGSLDTDKFPNLNNGANAYLDCSAALRAQVPEAYGGTMTVS